MDACEVSNANEFILSHELEQAFDDNAKSLKIAYTSDRYKQAILDRIGQTTYDE